MIEKLQKIHKHVVKRNENGVKHLLMSKTVWANIIAVIVMLVNRTYGYNISPDVEIQVLAFVNIALRKITNENVRW
jgi:hypothetical protein